MLLQPENNLNRYTLVVMSQTAGEWLRDKRKKLGMRQEDVANRARVSISYISTIERGQKHSITDAQLRPEPEKIKRIAKAVKGDPDELLVLYGYAPLGQSGEVVKLPDVGQLAFLKDLPPDQARKYELAVKVAIAQAKAMMEAENEN